MLTAKAVRACRSLIRSSRPNSRKSHLPKPKPFKSALSLNTRSLGPPLAGIALSCSVGFALAKCALKENKEEKFFALVKSGSVRAVRKFLAENKFEVNKRHPLGWTALSVAAVNGNVDMLKFLLDNGADPNLGDEFTNLFRVAKDKNLPALDVMLQRENEFSENLNAKGNYLGFTPLHYAVLIDNMECIMALIAAGANPGVEASGYKPADLAKSKETKAYLSQEVLKYEKAEKIREAEARRKFPLEQRLKQFIVGQEAAINVVASAIRRKENGWADDEHPLVFLFLGSSGIGKTELAKQLAYYIHKNNKNAFIRLDMSEYQEKHEVAKLIGAPPGYVGHDDGGQLTKQLKTCPNAVVLFDEVDKAHPDVLTVLLQLFDEGRLTDGKGKTITCKDATFIMTSNLAADEIADHAIEIRAENSKLKSASANSDSKSDEVTISNEFKNNVVRPILKKHFKRDEFLGRINEIVYFLPFSNSELNQLVSRELMLWAAKAKKKHGISLSWDAGVESVIASGYNHHYGARSIKHEVERRVVAKLASAMEAGVLKEGAKVKLYIEWPTPSSAKEPSIEIKMY